LVISGVVVLFSKYVRLILVVLVLAASLVVIVEDLREEYTWIIPLNTPRHVSSWYSKSTVTIALVDLESEKRSLIVYSGVVGDIIVDECSTCYAVIVASGLNFYVALFTTILTVLTVLVVYSEKKLKPLVIVLLFALFITAISTLYLYIKAGESIGYDVKEYLSEPVKLENLTLTLIPIGDRRILAFNYMLRDNITKLSLVSVKIQNYEYEKAFILVNSSGQITLVQDKITLYVDSRELEVIVLSQEKNLNSTLEYYKLEFTPQQTHSQLYFTITLVLVILHSTTITVKSLRRILKEYREIRV